MRLTLAAGQAESVAGDLAANATTAAELVREAGDRGAEVVVLPEAFLTGYDARRVRRATAVARGPAARADP